MECPQCNFSPLYRTHSSWEQVMSWVLWDLQMQGFCGGFGQVLYCQRAGTAFPSLRPAEPHGIPLLQQDVVCRTST